MLLLCVTALVARGFLLSLSAVLLRKQTIIAVSMSKVYFGAGLVTGTTVLALSPYTVRRVEGDSMRPTFNPDEKNSNGG